MDPITLNFLYAACGGLMLILFAGISFMIFRAGLGFSIRTELKNGNTAVGITVLGIFVGLGIGMGLVIGLSLN